MSARQGELRSRNVYANQLVKARAAVTGLLAQVPQGQLIPRISRSKFQHEIYVLHCRYPDIFGGLLFDTNWSTPYSEQLENIWGELNLCGLRQWTEDGKWLFRGMPKVFARSSGNFTPKELKIIRKEGKDLAERIARGELAPTPIS